VNGETAIGKQTETVKYFSNLGDKKLNPVFPMAKAANNKKKIFLHQQIGLTFKKRISKVLHLEHDFMWC